MNRLVRPRLSRFAIAAAIAIVALAPSSAAAGEAVEPDIVAAENAFAQLAYEDAIAHAESAIAAGGLSHDQLVRAYKVLALSRAGTDQTDRARDAFVQLLTYDPDFALDASHGPKIRQPFLEAKGFWRGQASRPGIDASTILREGEGGTLRVTVRDPTHVVKRAVVAYRWGTAAKLERVDATVGDQVVRVPPPPAGTTRLDYFVQAFDAQGDAVFELGNESVPKTALVDVVARDARVVGGRTTREESRASGVLSSPIFWVIAGAVVAGGVTTGLVLATRKTETRVESLPPTRANVGPILYCGAERCR